MQTKQEVIKEVERLKKIVKSLEYKIEDLNAIWHWLECLEETLNKHIKTHKEKD